MQKVLLAIIFGLIAAAVAVWWVLLGSICSEPSTPNIATQHIVPYNCHGSIVFITPLQDGILHWLVPIGFALVLVAHAIRKHRNP